MPYPNNTRVVSSVNTKGFNFFNGMRFNHGMKLGERLHIARTHANLTQDQLGDKADCGQGVVSKIERGDQESSAYVPALARACGVSTDWLYDETGPMLTSKRIDQYPEAIRHMVKAAENMEAQDQYRAARLVDTLAEPPHLKNGTQ